MAKTPTPPAAARDCLECGRKDGMKLRQPALLTLYYVCEQCGSSLTIPPPPRISPADPERRGS